jgi:hypothetical protein
MPKATIQTLLEKKQPINRSPMLAVSDFPFAKLAEEAKSQRVTKRIIECPQSNSSPVA